MAQITPVSIALSPNPAGGTVLVAVLYSDGSVTVQSLSPVGASSWQRLDPAPTDSANVAQLPHGRRIAG